MRQSLNLILLLGAAVVWAQPWNQANSGSQNGRSVDPNDCSPHTCKLPDCMCAGKEPPAKIDSKSIPQIVMFTFDDDLNKKLQPYFEELFPASLTNPNGCPVTVTFFVTHNNTDYDVVREMYDRGHEIGSHSVTHRMPQSWWRYGAEEDWEMEIQGQREYLADYAGIPIKEIRGMRAPYLDTGGDEQFKMLKKNNFDYDASFMSGGHKNGGVWPFTLDFVPSWEYCTNLNCPKERHPGIWEVPLNQWMSLDGNPCAMADSCDNSPSNKGEMLDFLWQNFNRDYHGNRAPVGVNMHGRRFHSKYFLEAMKEFVKTISEMDDVYIITVNQMLSWMRNPVDLINAKEFPPWFESCKILNRKPPEPKNLPITNLAGQIVDYENGFSFDRFAAMEFDGSRMFNPALGNAIKPHASDIPDNKPNEIHGLLIRNDRPEIHYSRDDITEIDSGNRGMNGFQNTNRRVNELQHMNNGVSILNNRQLRGNEFQNHNFNMNVPQNRPTGILNSQNRPIRPDIRNQNIVVSNQRNGQITGSNGYNRQSDGPNEQNRRSGRYDITNRQTIRQNLESRGFAPNLQNNIGTLEHQNRPLRIAETSNKVGSLELQNGRQIDRNTFHRPEPNNNNFSFNSDFLANSIFEGIVDAVNIHQNSLNEGHILEQRTLGSNPGHDNRVFEHNRNENNHINAETFLIPQNGNVNMDLFETYVENSPNFPLENNSQDHKQHEDGYESEHVLFEKYSKPLSSLTSSSMLTSAKPVNMTSPEILHSKLDFEQYLSNEKLNEHFKSPPVSEKANNSIYRDFQKEEEYYFGDDGVEYITETLQNIDKTDKPLELAPTPVVPFRPRFRSNRPRQQFPNGPGRSDLQSRQQRNRYNSAHAHEISFAAVVGTGVIVVFYLQQAAWV